MKAANIITKNVHKNTSQLFDGINNFTVKPVIKLSFEGILLFANSSGINFLERISKHLKIPAINYLIKHCPSPLDPDCNLDVCLKLDDHNYYFSIVAFKEAGYVGLYGYRQERIRS